jgi:hypothetical protein
LCKAEVHRRSGEAAQEKWGSNTGEVGKQHRRSGEAAQEKWGSSTGEVGKQHRRSGEAAQEKWGSSTGEVGKQHRRSGEATQEKARLCQNKAEETIQRHKIQLQVGIVASAAWAVHAGKTSCRLINFNRERYSQAEA